jgi:hypothetical protein
MVKLADDEIHVYPNLRDFVTEEIPKVPKNLKVFNAYTWWGGFLPGGSLVDKAGTLAARWSLLYGGGPAVGVGEPTSGGKPVYAQFNPAQNRDKITVHRLLAMQFDYVRRMTPLVSKELVKLVEQRLEAVILHELVHWADFADYTEASPEKYRTGNYLLSDKGDIGDWAHYFEVEAYGLEFTKQFDIEGWWGKDAQENFYTPWKQTKPPPIPSLPPLAKGGSRPQVSPLKLR